MSWTFCETGLTFSWFEWRCVGFFLKANIALVCRMELKWSQDKSICTVFTCLICVYVDDVVRQRLERVQTSILAEGHYQVEIGMNILWILCMLWLYPFIHPHDFEICNSRLSYLKSIYCISLYYRTSSTEKAGLLMGNPPHARSCSAQLRFFSWVDWLPHSNQDVSTTLGMAQSAHWIKESSTCEHRWSKGCGVLNNLGWCN